MPTIFGKSYTRDELRTRVGRMDQLCGARPSTFSDGRAAGIRAVDFWTGSGLEFTVSLDRGMDVTAARFQGKSLCWRSANGDAHPAFYESPGLGFLRSFAGGMVTTCGLTNVGSPGVELGEELPLHGRISHIPAENVHVDAAWDGDDYLIWATGRLRESRVFGENVVLTRKIFTKLGESRFWIHDSVVNEGFEKVLHMILYHVNFGFPVVDDGSELLAPVRSSKPRDAEAEQDGERYAEFHAPRPDYQEKVYYLEMAADEDGRVPVGIVKRDANAGTGFGAYLEYSPGQLPRFVEWKMMGQGNYVVGLEPANCLVEGRAKERAEGRLQFLEPGEQREYRLEIGVLPSALEIAAFEERVRALQA